MRLISENKYPSLISEAQSQWRTLKSNGVRSKVMAQAVSQRLKPEIVAAAPIGVKES